MASYIFDNKGTWLYLKDTAMSLAVFVFQVSIAKLATASILKKWNAHGKFSKCKYSYTVRGVSRALLKVK